MNGPDAQDLKFDSDGLVTAVAQDATTGTVLMVAMMNQEALERTRQTGLAHFWSRSRQQLWLKGETSGNLLSVEAIQPDCDGDTLLLSVRPAGPCCHLNRRSCFAQPAILLDSLRQTIDERRALEPEDSYTVFLLKAGVPAITRKIGEEAVEVILAGHERDNEHLLGEVADLWFHSLVLLAFFGLGSEDVLGVLKARHAAGRPDFRSGKGQVP